MTSETLRHLGYDYTAVDLEHILRGVKMRLRNLSALTIMFVLAPGCGHSISESDRDLLKKGVSDIERGGIIIGGHAEWAIVESRLDSDDSISTQVQKKWEANCQSRIATIPGQGELGLMKDALSVMLHCRARGDELLLHFISAAYRLNKALLKRPPKPIDSLLIVTRQLLAEHDTLSLAWEVNRSQFNSLARSMDFRDTVQVGWMTRKEIVNDWFYILNPKTKELLLAKE